MGRIVGAVQRVVANRLAGARSMDKVAVADINADMIDSGTAGRACKEDQIAGLQVVAGNLGYACVLRSRGMGQADIEMLVDIGCEARTVKTLGGRTAINIGNSPISNP